MAELIPGYRLLQSGRCFIDREEIWSPSQVSLAERCETAWMYRYLLGLEEYPTRGRVFGQILHATAEAHFRGDSLYHPKLDQRTTDEIQLWASSQRDPQAAIHEILEEAPRRFESGVGMLPRRAEAEWLEVEGESVTTIQLPGDDEPVRWRTICDVVHKPRVAHRNIMITDHKTTRGAYADPDRPGDKRKFDPWAYVPRAHDLYRDLQVNIYALRQMNLHEVNAVDCRWVYYLSDFSHKPQASFLEFTVHRQDAESRVAQAHKTIRRLRTLLRAAKQAGPGAPITATYPHAPFRGDPCGPCAAYAGCGYHIDRGGLCQINGTKAERIAAATPKP